MTYVISYELNRPGQTYETFWEALRELGARPVLLSQWVVSDEAASAASIYRRLRRALDAGDRLLVFRLDVFDCAGYNLLLDPHQA